MPHDALALEETRRIRTPALVTQPQGRHLHTLAIQEISTVMNIDATFEVVKARQADLRLLAGPQPMIPFTEPPFDPLRRRVGRVMATLGAMIGVTRPTRQATSGRAPA